MSDPVWRGYGLYLRRLAEVIAGLAIPRGWHSRHHCYVIWPSAQHRSNNSTIISLLLLDFSTYGFLDLSASWVFSFSPFLTKRGVRGRQRQPTRPGSNITGVPPPRGRSRVPYGCPFRHFLVIMTAELSSHVPNGQWTELARFDEYRGPGANHHAPLWQAWQ
jgi:hypothetical protein